MLDRLISAVVALSMAFLVWLYMRSRDQEILDNVPVPVQVVLAASQEDQYDLEVTGPGQIPVSFTGPPSRLREVRNLLQHGELRIQIPLTVPAERLEESRYLDTISVSAADVHPPPGVTPLVIEGRNHVAVVLHRLVERQLPVRLEQTTLERTGQVTLEPPSVLVRGPQEILDRIRSIPTVAYGVPSAAAATSKVWTAENIAVVQEIEGRRIRTTPAVVTAQITLQPQQKVYELPEVAIQFLAPANFPLRALFTDERAGKIALRLLGPAGEENPVVTAFVDLGTRKWEPGLYEEPVRLQLPKDFQLAQNSPRPVAFQLVPGDSTAKTPTPISAH
jgi:hypothetical protein